MNRVSRLFNIEIFKKGLLFYALKFKIPEELFLLRILELP
jgi:hypothetical protein